MPSRTRYWQVFRAVFVAQLASGVMYAALSYSFREWRSSWFTLAAYYSAINLVWAALSPIVFWLGYRFPVERLRWKRNLAIHLVAAFTLSFLALAYQAAFDQVVRVFPPMVHGGYWAEYMHLVAMYFQGGPHSVPQVGPGVLIYFAILGGIHAFDYYQRYRDHELQTARLSEQLALSHLQVLRAQLQPHFLFNTLNSIVGLIRNKENAAAVNMTTQLSDLLRQILAYSDKQEAPLREELEVTRRYLDIQQMRFSDRLRLQIDAAPDTLDALVPSLLLQPLVENALRHGVAHRATDSVIALRTERRHDMLAIEVYNDGPPLPANWRMDACAGLGLANIRARLDQHYRGHHTFTLSNTNGAGVTANIAIPFSKA